MIVILIIDSLLTNVVFHSLNLTKLIHKYVASGNLLDVGCSTGEFCRYLSGMEIYMVWKSMTLLDLKINLLVSLDLFNSSSFFDCIVFRGTIQHVDVPFS